jgi:hypothetical protein
MKIKRLISVYSIRNDNLIKECDISNIQVDTLNEILPHNEEDPNFYMVYKLNKEQFEDFRSLIPLLSTIDFDGDIEIYLETYRDNIFSYNNKATQK